jgi:hypothetical protein
VLRWTARGLSALILLVWGVFLIAHLVGDAGRASRPLNGDDYIVLAAMGGWLAGLALAWKWELAGGALTLAAVVTGAAVNWGVVMFPGTLVPVAGALFVLSWWLGPGVRSRRSESDGRL